MENVRLRLPCADLLAAMAGWEREQARKRQAASLKQGDDLPSASIDANGDSGRVREVLAAKAGVGVKTVERAIKVRERGTEALNARVRAKRRGAGKMLIRAALGLARGPLRVASETNIRTVKLSATAAGGRIPPTGVRMQRLPNLPPTRRTLRRGKLRAD